jgi:hypothetical protein
LRTFNKPVATTIPLNANYLSPYVQLKNIYTYSVAFIVTGAPTGIVFLQASNDPETNDTQYNTSANQPPAVGPVNWISICGSDVTMTAAGETFWNVRDIGYNYVRLAYQDNSSGASTAKANMIFNGKGT